MRALRAALPALLSASLSSSEHRAHHLNRLPRWAPHPAHGLERRLALASISPCLATFLALVRTNHCRRAFSNRNRRLTAVRFLLSALALVPGALAILRTDVTLARIRAVDSLALAGTKL